MPQQSISLRPAQIDDGPALAEIRARAMRPSLEAVGRFDPQRVRSRFLEAFDPQYTRTICVEQERVGFVVARPVGEHLLLDHLYLEPANHGMGIGSAVLRMVITEAQSSGKAIRVGALKQSPSNDFYVRHGFKLESQNEWDNYYSLQPSEA